MGMIGYFAVMTGISRGQNPMRLHKWSALLLVVLLSTSLADAQLINGGFESSSGFPNAPGMWHLLEGWNNAQSGIATPDFFHLDGTLGGDLPETPIALVMPHGGRGLGGLAVIKRNGAGQPLSREYFVQQLSTPLIPGQYYSLSFHFTNGVRLPTSSSGLAVSGVGLALSVDQPVQFGDGLLDLSSVFAFPYARYEEDWQQVTMTFQADEPSRYLTLGVFLPDEELEVEIRSGENPSLAYYFVDDFSIEIATPPGEPEPVSEEIKKPVSEEEDGETTFGMFVPNAFSPNGDGLNDLFQPQVGDVQPSSFGIYSRWGERIVSLDPVNPSWDGRNMEGRLLEPGVYIWMLEWPRSIPKGQRQQQGAVMLLH